MMYGEKIKSSGSGLLSYCPLDYANFQDHYTIDEKIYDQQLSPSVIYIGTDINTGQKVAIKELKKSKLTQSFQHCFATNEISLHYCLSRISDNIAKAPNYYESSDAYYLVMELSEDPNYFEDLFENVYILLMLALLSSS